MSITKENIKKTFHEILFVQNRDPYHGFIGGLFNDPHFFLKVYESMKV